MVIRFAPTFARFKKALKLLRKVRPASQRQYVLLMWVAPAAALLSLMNDIVTYIVMPRFIRVIHTPGGVTADIAVFLVCALCPLLELHNRRVAYRRHLSRLSSFIVDGELHLSISNEGVELQRNDEQASIKHPWNLYGSFIQDESTVLLLSADKKQFQYFPLDAFTSNEFAEFSGILARHLGKGTIPC
jgi:hypothetical protein